jgi:hypothetical protein
MDEESVSESSNVRCDAMRCTANAQEACPVQSALVHYQRANRLPSAQQHCTRSPFRRGWRMTQAAEWVVGRPLTLSVSRERGGGGSKGRHESSTEVQHCCILVQQRLTRLAWRSSLELHIGQRSMPPCSNSNNSAVGPSPRPSLIRIRGNSGAWGPPGHTTDTPLIGADPGVAATLQNCGECRTSLTTQHGQPLLSL